MRYLGNKTKLLIQIEEFIKKNNIVGLNITDLFAGTGSVGDHFKGSYKITANDFMYYSYVINRAKIMNSDLPTFRDFYKNFKTDIFDWLNKKTYESNGHFFIYNNYTPIGNRMFFTEENALKIDGIRITIEDLYKKEFISEEEYYFLLGSLLESVNKVSNTSGTYEAFFKFWESRALKKFTLEPLTFNKVNLKSDKNEVFSMDANELVKTITGDIVYIDTPYTVTQYSSAYHILETIARYDYPIIKGIGGKRSKGKNISLYSRKNQAYSEFEDLLRKLQFKDIIISYSNQSLLEMNDLIELCKKYAKNEDVIVEEIEFQQYKNHRGRNKSNKLKEYLLYFQKDFIPIKSPLNYSGSKDTIIRNIVNELPKSIDVFVDVMGGAFNVGANVYANKYIQYNEINEFVYDIVKWLLSEKKEDIIKDVESTIRKFNLSKADKNNYLNLRNTYNRSKDKVLLYVLHMYSFQNMIRFNSNKKMNTPIGVAGYSKDMRERILNFTTKTKEIQFTNLDYINIDYSAYNKNTVFYFDPPYYITSASYNDGKRGFKGWSADEETELLDILLSIDRMGYKFVLSNVIKHRDRTNFILLDWIKEHNFRIVDVGATGWRYKKNEIIVINY